LRERGFSELARYVSQHGAFFNEIDAYRDMFQHREGVATQRVVHPDSRRAWCVPSDPAKGIGGIREEFREVPELLRAWRGTLEDILGRVVSEVAPVRTDG
jgi:hypothetical protein